MPSTCPTPIRVRPFKSSDTAAVRALCCDTGHAGQPIDGIFPDRDIFADFWTAYYTRYEPGAIWVAETGPRIVGYVMGCFNEGRRRRIMRTRILPRLILRALMKGLVFEPKVWSLIAGALVPKAPEKTETFFKRPAGAGHLHINLDTSTRRKGVGRKLLGELERAAKRRGVPMLSAETREGNVQARIFFENLGFRLQECRLGYRVRGQSFNVVVLAKDLR